MRVYVAVFALCIVATIMTSQPHNSPTLAQKDAQTQPHGNVTTAQAADQNCQPCNNPPKADGNPPKWYTPLERPEWWLVILGFPTIVILMWQAFATSSAAEATLAGVEAQINKDRARVRIIADKVAVVTDFQGIGCTLENYGPTHAFVTECCARLILTPEREMISTDYGKCIHFFSGESIKPDSQIPMKAMVSLEPDKLTAGQAMWIKLEESFVHFYGFVKYRDVFDRNWKRRIHLRWKMRWGGTFQGMIMEWWETVGLPEENSEVRDDMPKPRWWKFDWLREAIERAKQADSGENPN